MHTLEHALASLHLQESGIPIYIQIRDQMLQAIGAGMLRPGAQMPTMREVAVALRVDIHTVRRAYIELEHARATITLRGRGTFVAEAPPQPDPRETERRIEALAHQAIASAVTAGLDPAELARTIVRLLPPPRPREA